MVETQAGTSDLSGLVAVAMRVLTSPHIDLATSTTRRRWSARTSQQSAGAFLHRRQAALDHLSTIEVDAAFGVAGHTAASRFIGDSGHDHTDRGIGVVVAELPRLAALSTTCRQAGDEDAERRADAPCQPHPHCRYPPSIKVVCCEITSADWFSPGERVIRVRVPSEHVTLCRCDAACPFPAAPRTAGEIVATASSQVGVVAALPSPVGGAGLNSATVFNDLRCESGRVIVSEGGSHDRTRHHADRDDVRNLAQQRVS